MDIATISQSVTDVLHDVTQDTIFDAPERFDALVRDLRTLVRTRPPNVTAEEIHGNLCSAPLDVKIMPRRAVMIQFFWSLPHPTTAGEILSALETM